jgi:2-C-methyl-D-erythritol 4-phosphate cytidylyltransferase
MSNCVIVVAAGSGERFGGATPKQHVLLRGRSVLAHSIALFEAAPEVGDIVVVVDSVSLAGAETTLKGLFAKVRCVVPGGPMRQDSVFAGFEAAAKFAPEVVFVHDGARPFPEPALLEAVYREALLHGAAIPVIPLSDTAKRVSLSGDVLETVSREDLFRAQTPQAFRASVLREALERAKADGVVATDESFLVERIGKPVRAVKGSERNIKITTPADLLLAECLLEAAAGERKWPRIEPPV